MIISVNCAIIDSEEWGDILVYIHDNQVFEWDEGKEQINIQKHKMSFRTALKVFSDVNRIEFFDELHSEYEDRFITIGVIDDVAITAIAMVVYTERGEVLRLISARLATKEEKEMYYNGNC